MRTMMKIFWTKESATLAALLVAACGVMTVAIGRVQALRSAASDSKLSIPTPVAVGADFAIGAHPDWQGDPASPYTLVEFMDYQCPPCRQTHSRLPAILESYKGKVRFTVRQYPLAMHVHAMPAALAAEAARAQGKFGAMNEALMTATDLSDAGIAKCAASVGLDAARLRVDQNAAKAAVRDDVAAGNRMGIEGTPTFYLCGPSGEVLHLSSPGQLPDFVR